MANRGPMGLFGIRLFINRGLGCGYTVLDTVREVRRDLGYMYFLSPSDVLLYRIIIACHMTCHVQ